MNVNTTMNRSIDEIDLNGLADAARQGSKEALETLIQHTQGYIYNLAIRMLKTPVDAEDATQEILIRIITHLGQFRGESAFLTWAYRIASNWLINAHRREAGKNETSFEQLAERLDASLALHDPSGRGSVEDTVDDAALTEEVGRNCTLGMLMCLDHEDRLALVLGELIGVSSADGATIMATSPDAYRKRLSRARQTLVAFVSQQCGLVNPANPCRCGKHVQNKIRARLLRRNELAYASTPHNQTSAIAWAQVQQSEIDQGNRALALFRAHPEYAARTDFADRVRQMFTPTDVDTR